MGDSPASSQGLPLTGFAGVHGCLVGVVVWLDLLATPSLADIGECAKCLDLRMPNGVAVYS